MAEAHRVRHPERLPYPARRGIDFPPLYIPLRLLWVFVVTAAGAYVLKGSVNADEQQNQPAIVQPVGDLPPSLHLPIVPSTTPLPSLTPSPLIPTETPPPPSLTPTLLPPTSTPEPPKTPTVLPTKTRQPSPTPEWWTSEAGRDNWVNTIPIVRQTQPGVFLNDERPGDREKLRKTIQYISGFSNNSRALDPEFGDKIGNNLPNVRNSNGSFITEVDPDNPIRFLSSSNIARITLHENQGVFVDPNYGGRVILYFDWQKDLTPNDEARLIIQSAGLLKEAWMLKLITYYYSNHINVSPELRQSIDTYTHALALSLIKYYSVSHLDLKVRQQLEEALNRWRTLDPWKSNGARLAPDNPKSNTVETSLPGRSKREIAARRRRFDRAYTRTLHSRNKNGGFNA